MPEFHRVYELSRDRRLGALGTLSDPRGSLRHQHGVVEAAVLDAAEGGGDPEFPTFREHSTHTRGSGAVSHNLGMEKKPNLCNKCRGARGKIRLI